MSDSSFSAINDQAHALALALVHAPECHLRGNHTEKIWFFRAYQGGDPANMIDWRQTAKGRDILVRTHEPITYRPTYFWIEPDWPTATRARIELITLTLAYLLAHKERAVGYLTAEPKTTTKISFIPSLFHFLYDTETNAFPETRIAQSFLVLALNNPIGEREDLKRRLTPYIARKNKGMILYTGQAGAELEDLCALLGWPLVALPDNEAVATTMIRLMGHSIEATR